MEELRGNELDSPARFCSGKPPRKAGTNHSERKNVRKLHLRTFSAFFSAQDMRFLDYDDKGEALHDEHSPKCVLENNSRCSDSETSSSKASTSYGEISVTRTSSSAWKGLCRLWKPKTMRRFSSFPPFGAKIFSRSIREGHLPISKTPADGEFVSFRPSWRNFTLSELRNATNNFDPDNIVGKGGYADVYRGCLNGQFVAVKRLTRGTTDERTTSFLSELGIMVHLRHPNIARLVGVGVDGGMYLVFELSPYGSLEHFLHGSKDMKNKLGWSARYKVALGTANGLLYLHEQCQRRIIHRDIKAANVLLSENLEPQICDFGLAKWLPEKLTHQTISCFEGTFGYLPPEYCMHGIVDEKTDVFAFGVLLLELLTGHKALDSSKRSLVIWAKPFLEKGNIAELIDPYLSDTYDTKQVKFVAQTAYMCVQYSAPLRPGMSQVIRMLKGEEDREEAAKMIQRSVFRRTYSEEIFDAEEYNATRYLNDLRRHEQIAFEF